MLGKLVVRVLGVLLMAWALFVLFKLTSPEVRDTITSMPAVFSRYIGMFAAGLGFLLLRRWGLYVYLIFMAAQWIVLFTVYGGQSNGPMWLGLVGPAVIVGLVWLNWRHLRPNNSFKPKPLRGSA